MSDRYINSDPDSPATEPEISPAGRDERPTRPDDQLPRPELSADDLQAMASDDEPGGSPDLPESTEHRQQLPDGSYIGENNIREGNVGGIIGGPHQQQGEGQGG